MTVGPTPRRQPQPGSFRHLPEVYDTFARLTAGPLLAYLDRQLPVAGERAVDLGCGTGVVTITLADRYTDVLGVDTSAPMLDLALRRPRPGVRYELRDMMDVSTERDGRFDLVVSTFALHHAPELGRALAHIRDLVRPGGLAVVVDVVGRRRSRVRQRVEAARTLGVDLTLRRRTARDAVDLYRAATHPSWLGHVAADRPLAVGDFDSRYLAALPGATVTALPGCRAVRWRAPGG